MNSNSTALESNATSARMANNTAGPTHVGFPNLFVEMLMYVVSSSTLVINAGIVLMFLIQRCRRRPSKSKLNPAGIFVLNLLISDALVGAMGVIITATFTPAPYAYTAWRYGCINRMTPRFFFRMGSHMALINVAVDRYIAILHTLHYRDYMTKKRCLALIGVGWVVPLVGTTYAYLGNDWTPSDSPYCRDLSFFAVYFTYIRMPGHIAALVAVVFIQCRVFFYLRRHERSESPQYLRQYSRKSAIVLLWVTSTYVVCWLPYDTMLPLFLFYYRPNFGAIFQYTIVLSYCSFLVNAFIFSCKTKNIREPIGELWRDLVKALVVDKAVTRAVRSQISVISGDVKHSSKYSSSVTVTSTSGVIQNEQPGNVAVHI